MEINKKGKPVRKLKYRLPQNVCENCDNDSGWIFTKDTPAPTTEENHVPQA
jgi:hypothetical protein